MPDESKHGGTHNKKAGMATKVYLVFERVNVTNNKQPHERLITVKLTREAADRVANSRVGCYVHKTVATK